MATFIKFYRMDPLDMTYERFLSMWNAIPEVQKQFMAKDPLQIQLDAKTAQINAYRAEKVAKEAAEKYMPWEL